MKLTMAAAQKHEGTSRHRDKKQIPSVGVAERPTPEKPGRIVARVAKDVKIETLRGMIREYVLPKSTVYTDEFRSYIGIEMGKSETDKNGEKKVEADGISASADQSHR